MGEDAAPDNSYRNNPINQVVNLLPLMAGKEVRRAQPIILRSMPVCACNADRCAQDVHHMARNKLFVLFTVCYDTEPVL